MVYAGIEDLEERTLGEIEEGHKSYLMAKLADAGALIDAVAPKASEETKKIVSCNMVLRLIGTEEAQMVPMGTTQGTVSALGYSQTWTIGGGGSSGELYLSKTDKRLLGIGNAAGFINTLGGDAGD